MCDRLGSGESREVGGDGKIKKDLSQIKSVEFGQQIDTRLGKNELCNNGPGNSAALSKSWTKQEGFPGVGGGAWGNGRCHAVLTWIQEPRRSAFLRDFGYRCTPCPSPPAHTEAPERDAGGRKRRSCHPLARTAVLGGPSRVGP